MRMHEAGAKNRLSDMLEKFAADAKGSRISLDDIVHMLGKRSIGALLLVFALPMALPIPAPGFSAVFGVPLVLISVQLVFGRDSVWFPQKILRHSIARGRFVKAIKHTLPVLRVLEHLVRPRAVFLCTKWVSIPAGVICVIMALTIALPVPFGNVVPGIAISLFAFGFIQCDGFAVIMGFLISVLAALIVWLAIDGAQNLLAMWPF